jgi:hypothetical protein
MRALQSAEKLDFCSCFWVAQRFTAAITGLFSVTALAAEGDCGARQEFFSNP